VHKSAAMIRWPKMRLADSVPYKNRPESLAAANKEEKDK